MPTGFLYDKLFLEHHPSGEHPESSKRLSLSFEYLQKQPWFASLVQVQPRIAEEEWIQEIHAPDYLKRAQEVCESGFAYLDTPDVGVSENSFEVAKLAAGGTLALADQMMAGHIQNGFAMIRPPGHHAEKDFAMGFCLLNNIAILARYLQKKYQLEKILILDWDVHHGNGTQHAFYSDPSVFYISTHQFPFYPGTGAAHETGEGRGKGTTLNCPLPAGSGDNIYEQVFREKILPAIDTYGPDAILISAGFDAHREDPLAQMKLSDNFFLWMTERLKEAAARHSQGRLLSLLEGGYNLQHLPHLMAAHIQALSQNLK